MAMHKKKVAFLFLHLFYCWNEVLTPSACKLQLPSSLNPKQFEIYSLCVLFLELELGYDLILFIITMRL